MSEPIRIERRGDVVVVHVGSEQRPPIDLAEYLQKHITRAEKKRAVDPRFSWLMECVPSRAKPVISVKSRIGRNDPCSCGSGKKFKTCCLVKNY